MCARVRARAYVRASRIGTCAQRYGAHVPIVSACAHTSAEPRAHVCSHELLEWQRTFEPPLTHHLVSHEDCADAIVHGKRTCASVLIRECESDVIVRV